MRNKIALMALVMGVALAACTTVKYEGVNARTFGVATVEVLVLDEQQQPRAELKLGSEGISEGLTVTLGKLFGTVGDAFRSFIGGQEPPDVIVNVPGVEPTE